MISIFNAKDVEERYVELKIREVSKETQDEYEEINNESMELEKTRSPLEALAYVSYFMGIIGILFLIVLVKNKGFSEMVNSIYFYIGIGLIGLAAIVFLIYHFIAKKKNPEITSFNDKTEKYTNACFEELKVPSDAIDFDVIFTNFDVNEEGAQKKKHFSLIDNLNVNNKVFFEDGKLCFSDISMVVGIEFDNGEVSVERIGKTLMLPSWNKKDAYNSPKYKDYRIKVNGMGMYFCKSYYKVTFKMNDIDYYMLVTKYDYEDFERLLKLNGISVNYINKE